MKSEQTNKSIEIIKDFSVDPRATEDKVIAKSLTEKTEKTEKRKSHSEVSQKNSRQTNYLPRKTDEWQQSRPSENTVTESGGDLHKVIKSKPKADKHIHPSICNITKRQQKVIEDYLKNRRLWQQKFEKRMQELEEEQRRIAEEEAKRLRELEEEKELYADEYEMKGQRKKRKKRSARRASMVSLGVKQVIAWKKSPRIPVKVTRTSNMRMNNTTYCRPSQILLLPVRPVLLRIEGPQIPVRETTTAQLRSKYIKKQKKEIEEKNVSLIKYPTRPRFAIGISHL